MKSYDAAIESFDPYKYLTQSVLETGASKLNTNLTKAETSMIQKGAEYLELVSEVYQASDENTSALQQDMNTAADGTKDNMTTQITLLKDSRTEQNQTNVALLGSFSEKLKFTRLGNLPYTEVYDFIINPVNLE